jgi:protein phosphatase
MSFFRRLFNNSSDEQSSGDESLGNNKATNNSNEQTDDPMATGELETAPIMDDTNPVNEEEAEKVLEKLDQTQPVDNEDDEVEEPTIPPDLEMNAYDTALAEEEDFPPGITRPLPSEPILPMPSGHLIFGQVSDQGMVRLNNQDAVFSFFFSSVSVEEFPDFGVFVVADGMGGHQEGEKASAITARIVANYIVQKIYVPMINGQDMNDADQPTIVEALVAAVQEANTKVREQVADGGTTLTAVVVRGEAAHIAHVGDSRAYWISSHGDIEQITRDHSVVQRLIELDQLTPEEAETHDQRNVLYRAIGQNEEVEVEIHRKRLLPDSYILICSDGLWNMVTNDEIREIIQASVTPQEACEKLVALANTHGGTDNITVNLIKTPIS